jgi:hypothetical protein
MNTITILGYVITMCLAPVAPFLVHRWIGAVWQAVKALQVLLRERRTGETLYDTAEAIAGDAHNWRGMTSPIGGCAGDIADDNEEPGLAAAVKRMRVGRERSEHSIADDRIDRSEKNAKLWEETFIPQPWQLIRSTNSIIAPQPPPQNSSGPALWPMIISELGDSETDRLVAIDMQTRHEFGVAKYGVPLVASNGRDHLADAYQEALDGVVYLRAELEKLTDRVAEHQVSPEDYKAHGRVSQLYIDMLDMSKEIREMIRERDGR